MRDRDLFGQGGRVQVIGQALGGLAHGVDVHAVGARAQHAAQTAGAEGEVAVKAVGDGGLVALDGRQLRRDRRVQVRLRAPPFVAL